MMHEAEPSSNEQGHFHRPVHLCEDVNMHATCASITSYRRARKSEKKKQVTEPAACSCICLALGLVRGLPQNKTYSFLVLDLESRKHLQILQWDPGTLFQPVSQLFSFLFLLCFLAFCLSFLLALAGFITFFPLEVYCLEG